MFPIGCRSRTILPLPIQDPQVRPHVVSEPYQHTAPPILPLYNVPCPPSPALQNLSVSVSSPPSPPSPFLLLSFGRFAPPWRNCGPTCLSQQTHSFTLFNAVRSLSRPDTEQYPHKTMVFSKLRASAALAATAYAGLASASSHMIMGGLNPIAIERVDPIVNPGGVSHQSLLYARSALTRGVLWERSVRVSRSRYHGCEQSRPELQLRQSAHCQLHVRAVPEGGPQRVLGCKFTPAFSRPTRR